MVVGVQRHAMATLQPGKGPAPILYVTGWTQGPVWTSAANLAPTCFDPRPMFQPQNDIKTIYYAEYT
jgi:hypothetical protein